MLKISCILGAIPDPSAALAIPGPSGVRLPLTTSSRINPHSRSGKLMNLLSYGLQIEKDISYAQQMYEKLEWSYVEPCVYILLVAASLC